MGFSMSKLCLYKLPFPAPFTGMSKVRTDVKCSYPASSKTVTAYPPLIKAVNAYLRMRSSKDYAGGLGEVDPGVYVAEYKSSVENTIHAMVYNSHTGVTQGCVYVTTGSGQQKYVGGDTENCRDNTATFLALLPTLMEDAEFKEYLEKYATERDKGFPNLEKAFDYIGVCCENAYRRIVTDAVKINKSDFKGGVLEPAMPKLADWQKGKFAPTFIIAGSFIFAAETSVEITHAEKKGILATDIAGAYRISSRELSDKEKLLVPVAKDGMYVADWTMDMIEEIKSNPHCRNILVYGPSGTGKSVGAKIAASAMGEPLYVKTCGADTDGPALTYEIIPQKGNKRVNVSPDDLEFDPVGTYAKITGKVNEDATAQDCLNALQNCSDNAITYDLVLSTLMKAVKYGGVIELQEPSVILQPGVLVILNALLEQDGVMELPTGEVIRRHPDCVLIMTMNYGYNGTRPLNQSVVDRMNLVYFVPLPERDVILERSCAEAGFEDKELAGDLVDLMLNLIKYCKEHRISDGEIGVRSMIDWLASVKRTNDVYGSAMKTVVRKATFNPKAIDELASFIADKYPPKRGGYAV